MTALMCDSCILLASNVLSCCWIEGLACWACSGVGLLLVGCVFVGGGVVGALLL